MNFSDRFYELSMKCLKKPGPRTSAEMYDIYMKIKETLDEAEDTFFDELDAELARLTGSDEYYAVGIDDFTDSELEQIDKLNCTFVEKNINKTNFNEKMKKLNDMPFMFDIYGSTYDSYESYVECIKNNYTFWVIIRKENHHNATEDDSVSYISFVDDEYMKYGPTDDELENGTDETDKEHRLSVVISTDVSIVDEEQFNSFLTNYVQSHNQFIEMTRNFRMLNRMIGGIVRSHEKWDAFGLISDYDFMEMSLPYLEYTAMKAVMVLGRIPVACSEEIRESIGVSFSVNARLFRDSFDIIVGKSGDVLFNVEWEKDRGIDVSLSENCPDFRRKRIESMVRNIIGVASGFEEMFMDVYEYIGNLKRVLSSKYGSDVIRESDGKIDVNVDISKYFGTDIGPGEGTHEDAKEIIRKFDEYFEEHPELIEPDFGDEK